MIKIITDSSSDIPLDKAKEIDVAIVPLTIIFDKEEFLDRYTITPDEFYAKLGNSKNLPTTSQPSPNSFLTEIEKAKNTGDDVIIITLSSKLSGTYQSATIAKQMSEYDNVHIIDSLNATLGLQFLVDEAVRLRNEGKEVKEIVDTIETIKHKIKLVAAVDTLEYFVKGGRLSKTGGMAGTLLKIKPIVGLIDGGLDVLGKSRGMLAASNKIIELIAQSGEMDLDYPVYVGYTGSDEGNEKFFTNLQNEFKFENYKTFAIGPTIGTHAGPGAKGIVYKIK